MHISEDLQKQTFIEQGRHMKLRNPSRAVLGVTALLSLFASITACRMFTPGAAILSHSGAKYGAVDRNVQNNISSAAAGALTLGEQLISDLGANLAGAGLTEAQVESVKAGARKELQVQVSSLTIQTDVLSLALTSGKSVAQLVMEIAGGAVIKGAMGEIAGVSTSGPEAASGRAALTGKIVSSSFKSIGNQSGAVDALAISQIAQVMVGFAIEGLASASLDGADAAAGVTAVSSAAIGSLASAGISSTDPGAIARAMMTQTVSSLSKIKVSADQLQNVIRESTSGAVNAMNGAGVDSANTLTIAGAIAGGSVAGLKNIADSLNLPSTEIAGAVQSITSGAVAGLKNAGLSPADVATAAGNIAGKSVSALGETGFSQAISGASAGAAAAGAVNGLSNAGVSATDIAASGAIQNIMKGSVSGLASAGMDASQVNSAMSEVVSNVMASISSTGVTDQAQKLSMVSDVVKGAVNGISESTNSTADSMSASMNVIASSATSALSGVGMSAEQISSTAQQVATSVVSAAVQTGVMKSENVSALASQINSGVATGLGTLVNNGSITAASVAATASAVASNIVSTAVSTQGSGPAINVDTELAQLLSNGTAAAFTAAGMSTEVVNAAASGVTAASQTAIASQSTGTAVPAPWMPWGPKPDPSGSPMPDPEKCIITRYYYEFNVNDMPTHRYRLISRNNSFLPTSCNAAPPLPAGLALTSDCRISGVPTAQSGYQSHAIVAVGTDGSVCNFNIGSSVFSALDVNSANYDDKTPPSISAVPLVSGSATVDASSANAADRSVTFAITLTDNRSLRGESNPVSVTLLHALSGQRIVSQYQNGAALPVPTTTYQFHSTIVFPRNSAAGNWIIERIVVSDLGWAGWRDFGSADLMEIFPAGIPSITNLDTQNTQDISPPTLTIGLSNGAGTVDSSNPLLTNRSIFPQLTYSDASGFQGYQAIYLRSESFPLGKTISFMEYAYGSQGITEYKVNLDSQSPPQPMTSRSLVFPYGSPRGNWFVARVYTVDGLGNVGDLYFDAPEGSPYALPAALKALRISNTASTEDLAAPVLDSFNFPITSFDKGSMGRNQSYAYAKAELGFSDVFGWAQESPNINLAKARFSVGGGMFEERFFYTNISSLQTSMSITNDYFFYIHPSTPEGTYALDSISLRDGAGNEKVYSRSQVLSLLGSGARIDFTVTKTAVDTDSDGILDIDDYCPTVSGQANATYHLNGCFNGYALSVSVSGLTSGTLDLMNQTNSDFLYVSSNGTHTFSQTISSSYNVAVNTQTAGHNCVLSNNVGTASTAVTVTAICTPNVTYMVGGFIANLPASTTVTLRLTYGSSNTIYDIQVIGTGTTVVFTSSPTFLNNADNYTVTVQSQPAGATCAVVSSGTGTINSADFLNVQINCI